MKTNHALFLLVVIVFANSCRAATMPDACGDDKARFDVKTLKNQPLPSIPAAGMAQIVFVENFDHGEGLCVECKVTTRVGVDGQWVGADYGNSYFVYNVTPGEHHLCVDWQSAMPKLRQKVGLLALTAEPGQIYYAEIKVKLVQYENGMEKRLALEPMDNDQGKYLVKIDPLAKATAKK
jgi:hypothetical protein